MVATLMTTAKLATLGLLKKNIVSKILFCPRRHQQRLQQHDGTKFYVIRQTFGKSYHNLNFIRVWPENFFEKCSWFKFNNLEQVPGIALNLQTKGKLKVRKLSELVSTSVEVTRGKIHSGGVFLFSLSWIQLNFLALFMIKA